MFKVVSVCLSVHKGSPCDHTWTCWKLVHLGTPLPPEPKAHAHGDPQPQLLSPTTSTWTCSNLFTWRFLLWDLSKLVCYVAIHLLASWRMVFGLLVIIIIVPLLFFKSISTFRQFFSRLYSYTSSTTSICSIFLKACSAPGRSPCLCKLRPLLYRENAWLSWKRNTQLQCMVTKSL